MRGPSTCGFSTGLRILDHILSNNRRKLVTVAAVVGGISAAALIVTAPPTVSAQSHPEAWMVASAKSGVTSHTQMPPVVELGALPQITAEEARAHAPIPPPASGVDEATYRARKRAAAQPISGGGGEVGGPPAIAPLTSFSADEVDPNTPATSLGIEGVNQTCSNLIPSDHGLAPGQNHIVQVVNACIAIYSKTGVLQTGYPKSLNAFLGLPSNAFTFDPRVLYDAWVGRFVVVVDHRDSTGRYWIWVAASATNNPTGTWRRYQLSVPATLTTDFPDFPTLGLDRDIIYVGANVFRGGSLLYDVVMFLPKARIYAGQAIGAFSFAFNFNVGGSPVDTLQPAHVMKRVDVPRAGFMVNTFNINFGGGQCSTGCNGLVVWAVSNALVVSGSPGVEITGSVIPTAFNYFFPPNARQPGCPSGVCLVDTGDVRISGQVTYNSGSLWGSFNTRRTNGQTTVGWFEMRPILNDNNPRCTGSFLNKCAQITGATMLNQDCYFCGGRGANGSDYFGTVVPNLENDATMVAAYSDDNTYPGVFYVSRRVTQAVNAMHDVGIFLATGQGFYQQLDSVGRNRWGDYTAAGSDSTGGGVTYFWFAGQYAKTLGGSRIWGTRIGRNAFSAVNQP